jgi:hypothetical protein
MIRWMRNFTSLIFIILIAVPAIPQEGFNPLYQPLPVVKRLSYENFRNIKLLSAAIMNYGGGEAELEKLVDQYAEASALYFQGKIPEAAGKFQDNEKAILKMAQDLAKKYRQDAEVMFTQAIKMNTKNSIMRALDSKKPNEYAEMYMQNGRFSFDKASDIYDRYINATVASPRELITSIYYFRKVKESVISMYSVTEYNKDKAKNQEMKDQMISKYKKDVDDNNNKVSKTMDKQN